MTEGPLYGGLLLILMCILSWKFAETNHETTPQIQSLHHTIMGGGQRSHKLAALRVVVDSRSVKRITDRYTNAYAQLTQAIASPNGFSSIAKELIKEEQSFLTPYVTALSEEPHKIVPWNSLRAGREPFRIFPVDRLWETFPKEANLFLIDLTSLKTLLGDNLFSERYALLFKSYCYYWYKDALIHIQGNSHPQKLNMKRLRAIFCPVLWSAHICRRNALVQYAAHCIVAIITKHNQADTGEPDQIDARLDEFVNNIP